MRVTPDHVTQMLLPSFPSGAKKGHSMWPRAFLLHQVPRLVLCLTADEAVEQAQKVRKSSGSQKTSPEDVDGMHMAAGI